jgi:iron(III) transport system substrate-binding protein
MTAQRALKRSQTWLIPWLLAVLAVAAAMGLGSSRVAAQEGSPQVSSAPAPSAPADLEATLAALYEAAQAEGQVLLIGPGAEGFRPLLDAFALKYPGITVEAVTARGPEIIARLDAEAASGQHTAGVMTSSLGTLFNARTNNHLEQYSPPAAAIVPDRFRDPEGWYVASAIQPYGIAYNTDLVPAEEAPTTWADLTDPRWQGKMISDDPRTTGGGQIFAVGVTKQPDLGWEFLEALGEQDITYSRDRGDIPNSVARGEFEIAFPISVQDFQDMQAASAPVQLVLPEQACECSSGYVSLVANAPQPNAAKLLINFFYSPEGQAALAEGGAFPTTPGAPVPEGFPPLDQIDTLPPLTVEDLENLDQYLTRFEEIFFQ